MPTASTYLTFAQLQLAAEARLERFGNQASAEALVFGNDRSSKFTDVDAAQFAREWTVVAHQANTSTGFSGTVFRYTGSNDPTRGLVNGQLVVSLRSTEFADDAARDNMATNTLEIREHGFAFGQIADMQAWLAQLNQPGGALAGQNFSVTGYSLGGHLATALNLLMNDAGQAGRITATYTFNGAGVGELSAGTTLTQALNVFSSARGNGSAALFSAPIAAQFYTDLRARLDGSATLAQMDQALTDLVGARNGITVGAQTTAELNVLIEAVSRSRRVLYEANRINAGLPSGGDGGAAQPVVATSIDATRLDYQLAVWQAQATTNSFASLLTDGLGAAYATNRAPLSLAGLSPIYDIYGAPLPSAVANSQHHYGEATPVFIEDQPLYRGNVLTSVPWNSGSRMVFGEWRLLVPSFNQNDFGDTHSLVLLVDSLSVQAALSRLMPSASQDDIEAIFRAASSAAAAATPFTQGVAEGDVLENVVNALSRIFMGPDATRLTGRLEGGTWANLADRNALHNQLRDLVASSAFTSAAGRVTLVPTAGQAAATARTDFAAFLSLYSLSPFTLRSANEADAIVVQAALAQNWGTLRTEWIADRNEVEAGRGAQNFSDTYLRDRMTMLQAQIANNLRNVDGVIEPLRAAGVLYTDAISGGTIRIGSLTTDAQRQQIWFGGTANESYSGAAQADRLYGGAGADTLRGQGGADWLEGNAGDDSLDGGAGADTLLGGTGNDVLNGGIDNDRLLGGGGLDVYGFGAGWGADVVVDSDGSGGIFVDGLAQIDGAGAIKIAEGAWQTPDRRINYSLVPMDAGRSDLFISFSDRNDVIRIESWSPDRNVGVVLPGEITVPPANGNALAGDIVKQYTGTTYATVPDGGYVGAGSQPDAADILIGTQTNDSLSGLGGNDGMSGGEGHDLLEGGAGHDLLIGGLGADTLNGGAGNDLIYGSGVGGIDRPTRTDFTPPTTTGVEVARGFSWVAARANVPRRQGDTATMRYVGVTGAYVSPQFTNGGQVYVETHSNVIDGGSGDDYIVAGAGRDVVHGGDDNDDIIGMRDDDLLFGDAGDDYIWGDGQGVAGTAEYTPADQQGDDTLIGGLGDDVLVGQGGRDQLYGGADDDMLWGDDLAENDVDTPLATHGQDQLDGGGGRDTLVGGGQDDTLLGDDGADLLWGDGSGTRTLSGAAHGSDLLDGGGDADEIHGGGANDTLEGGTGNDRLWGDDDLNHRVDAIWHGNDVLSGGDGDDYLEGGARSDTLYGGSDNDSLLGDGRVFDQAEYGADYLDGGEGDDELEGGGGADTLSGGSGDDVLVGDSQIVEIGESSQLGDVLYGDGGNDLLRGNGGGDTLLGGTGIDRLEGGAGDDVYRFAAGDLIPGDSGLTELIDDEDGDNRVVFDEISIASLQTLQLTGDGDVVLGLAGGERLVLTATTFGAMQSFSFSDGSLTASQVFGRLADDVFRGQTAGGQQILYGGRTAQSVYVVGRPGGAMLSGGRGNDTLEALGGGNRYLFDIGDGTDVIHDSANAGGFFGSNGASRIVLGSGIEESDLRFSLAQGDLIIHVGEGTTDSIRLTSAYGESLAAPLPIDRIEFADGTSLDLLARYAEGFDVTGTETGERLAGSNGPDRLDGGGGDDYLNGGAGSDTYVWGLGRGSDEVTESSSASDVDIVQLDGSLTSANLLLLRLGTSLILHARTSAECLTIYDHFGALGIEQIAFSDGTRWTRSDIEARLTNELTEGNDTVFGSGQADTMAGFGGADALYGGAGGDFLDGGVGNDQLAGQDGDDRVLGGDGNDQLAGGPGSDQLDGQSGVDYLFGGEGNDLLSDDRFDDDLWGDSGDDTLVGGRYANGGSGSDTYVLTAWPESTAISIEERVGADGGVDRLEMPAGVGLNELRFFRQVTYSWDDLFIEREGSFGRVWLRAYFQDDVARSGLEEIRLSDGTVLRRADVISRLEVHPLQTTDGDDGILGLRLSETIDGGAGNDTLDGSLGDDVLLGGEGDDDLSGGDGNDTLRGGAGYDRVTTGAGSDAILFGRDSGRDFVSHEAIVGAAADRIVFDADVDPNQVTLTRDESSLIVHISGSTTQMTVNGFYFMNAAGQPTTSVRSIEFADGTVWGHAAILARSVTPGVIVETTPQGIDTVTVGASATLAVGQENLTLGGELGARLVGNELDNVIRGGAGDDALNGPGLDDAMRRDGFTDLWRWSLLGYPEFSYVVRGGSDTLIGGAGDDLYFTTSSNGENLYSIYYESDIGSADDAVIESLGGGTDTVVTTAYFETLDPHVENLVAINRQSFTRNVPGDWPTPIHHAYAGNDLGNRIDASRVPGSVRLDGGGGADVMIGNSFDPNVYVVDHADDLVIESGSAESPAIDAVESSVSYELAPEIESLVLTGSAAIDGTGNALDNLLDGSGNGAINRLVGGAGNDRYRIGAGDQVVERADEGRDTVIVGAGSAPQAIYSLSDYLNVEGLTLEASAGAAALIGTTLDDELTGNVSPNLFEGGQGDDTMHDGRERESVWGNSMRSGADSMYGGDGNDVIFVSGGGDVVHGGAGADRIVIDTAVAQDSSVAVHFGHGEGHDTIEAFYSPRPSVTVRFGPAVSSSDLRVERQGADMILVLSSTSESVRLMQAFDSAESQTLTGYVGGAAFADGVFLEAGHLAARWLAGNENQASDGRDVLLGGSGNDVLTAGGGDDVLWGQGGDDDIAGGSGNDTLRGGVGDDVYRFEAGGGHDTIREEGGYDRVLLGDGLLAEEASVFAEGSSVLIEFSSGGSLLLADVLSPGGSQIIEAIEFANGTVWTAPMLRFMAAQVRGTESADTLVGTADAEQILGLGGNDSIDGLGGDDLLQGGSGNDTLVGSAGIDTLEGGSGNDLYRADASDVIVEQADGGSDTIESAVTWRLPDHVERLQLTGGTPIDGYGNVAANALLGNGASNLLDGEGGVDTMTGYGGDDLYVVDHAADVVVEASNAGIDTVQASVGWSLGSNIEHLALTGAAAINGTGNTLSNRLAGNGAANRLDGGSGVDTMLGGAGDDVYVVDNASDFVVELAGEGIDRVESSVSHVLGADIEHLTLTGTASTNATGNAAANSLTGNSGVNRLDGGAGADSMTGGAGNDTYVVDTLEDLITELSGGGTDTVESVISWTLGAQLENLTLTGTAVASATGNSLANTLRGNSGNNVLSGLAGSDTMIGGTGDDTYVVDVTTDVVTESASQGTDLVQSAVTWTLGSNVENLTLTGSSTIHGTGNTLSNVLIGNSASNTLTGGDGHDTIDGGAGTDSMVGGNGDDVYFVNVSTDVVTEASSAGTDLVNSVVTWTLGSNVENLTLTGSSAINGTGNTLNNVLTGNAAANTLAGAAGNDIYVGGLGNDSLTDSSTSSADVYRWGLGQGNDSVSDAGGSDRIEILPGVSSAQVTLARSGNNLQIGISGASDVLTVLNWYTSSANRIEEIRLSDGSIIGAAAAPQSVTTGSVSALGERAMADSETMPSPWRGPATATAWLIASKSDLLLDAMAQFDPPAGVVLAGDADRLVTTMPALAANAM